MTVQPKGNERFNPFHKPTCIICDNRTFQDRIGLILHYLENHTTMNIVAELNL